MSSIKATVKYSTNVADRPRSTARTALVLVPGGLLALLSTTIVGVAVPDIITDLGTDVSSAQWVTTIYLLAGGIGIALSGWASIRFDVKSVWLVAIALFTLGALASAMAPSMLTLTGARAIQGIGGGALEPLMLTALARAAGPARMGRVMGAVAAVMAIGPLAGPALGGLGVDTVGWRATFGITAVLGAVVAVGSWLILRREPTQPSRLDLPGLLLIATATVLVLLGLSRGATPDGFDLAAVTELVGGAAALAVFIWWCRRRGDRAIIDLATFRAKGFGPAIFIMAMVGAAIYPLFFGLPQYYQSVVGLSPLTAGLLMIPYGLGNLVAMPIAGKLSDTIGSRRLIWTGTGITLIGFVLVLLTGPGTHIAAFAGMSLLIGLGLGSIGAPAVSSLYRALAPELIPSGSSTLFIVNQLGGSLGVAILTVLIGGAAWTADVGTTPLWVPVAATLAIALAAIRVADAPAPSVTS